MQLWHSLWPCIPHVTNLGTPDPLSTFQGGSGKIRLYFLYFTVQHHANNYLRVTIIWMAHFPPLYRLRLSIECWTILGTYNGDRKGICSVRRGGIDKLPHMHVVKRTLRLKCAWKWLWYWCSYRQQSRSMYAVIMSCITHFNNITFVIEAPLSPFVYIMARVVLLAVYASVKF